MKKKLVSLFLVFALVFATVLTIVACTPEQDTSAIEAKIAEAQNMTTEQLLEKAKEEKGSFLVYGTSSRVATAMTGFIAKYGEALGLSKDNASHGKKGSDSEIYTTLMNEHVSANNSKGASMAMLQDGAQLYLYRNVSTMLQNYVPFTMKDKVSEGEQIPLVHQYVNKLFIWNKLGTGADLKVTNVWQIVDDTFMQGREIYFKNPSKEQVNMNFLVMLTSDTWATKLETAYKAYHDGAAATDVGEGKTYANYGYKWVHDFIARANYASGAGDTDICQALNRDTNAGNLGLFVLSKLRDTLPDAEHADRVCNLQVAAWKEEAANQLVSVDPFAGFMYPLYCQVMTNGPRPYTAMLFINYLMEEDGFQPWGKDWGAYSSNSSIGVNEGDKPLSFWREKLVIEDPAYLQANKAAVTDFVNKIDRTGATN